MKKQLSITARRCIIATLLFPLWGLGGLGSGFGLSAQVSVSNMATTYTANNNKISFTVTWTQQPHNNQIWVITDYIKVAGTATTGSWSRATVTAVAKNSGTGSVSTVSGNRGFWLNTSGSSGSAKVTATLSLAAGVDKFNWCAYALNTPPKAVLIAGGGYKLQGTPPFVVNGAALGAGVKTFGAGTCITSLTDATDNPTSILPAAPSITLSAGSSAQTATQNAALPALKYTTANASGASLTSGSFPAGVTGSWANNTYTISGTPTATGAFTYTVATTNSQSCTNASKTGTVTVNAAFTGCVTASITLGTVGFTSSATWVANAGTSNSLTISAPVTATYCNSRTYTSFDGGSAGSYKADCAKHYSDETKGNWFSWCLFAQYAEQLCPTPWRVPTKADACNLLWGTETCPETEHSVGADWLGFKPTGIIYDDYIPYEQTCVMWTSTEYTTHFPWNLMFVGYYARVLSTTLKARGATVRCVK